MRAEYDPAVRSLRQRELAKAAELAAARHSTSLALSRGCGTRPHGWRAGAGSSKKIRRSSNLSDDLLVVPQALAEFHRRFPMQTPLRGTSRTWLSTTIETTARRIEALLNP
ncbi:hypothetical protein FBY35_7013 [Streptomyces sp. SLBN-118]|uniref:hypothetical protein n=1 Tax=Streptomyces sp. SLBN-118 TaxID=2768454 RepID=UPI001167F70B|nr:hypothetical protein [Streptomyces sp. SLBN-118]TQK45447.1 hypothetical protein FBY35_7013 [Streptomyces sp. SLBN-118]